MLSDPIADMLTRIRNATRTHKESVDIPASNFKEQLARLLVQEGYVASVERTRPEGQKFDVLRLTLKYGQKREQVIKHIERVSRPGRRAYVSAENLPRIQRGLGLAVVSTSKGLLPDREARKQGVGGEVVCVVW
ncbi:30S ribosomal protein S8 [Deinococcus metallilatus]|uniref:Small ribosomal subunit protein uS8 n=2 Tax=Deinococcus TaxID=1298 RepID=A0AAJ5F043_9DEIO|nr:30S ribosomal protein S8 [Deinococcus metallilatus]MBB5296891.1 small subunit ribosomal protein S8 [Deinococcus metallilatus]QBY09621.1 30S ribosomal protein S8 [Deinococcus metallilatus]RXJ09112.1 30S ribosomal protein S8 [Deinococcus metallilatus]TLK20897.1 30S ribosomal protein S8 [Deinococcus metallilatus]GMA13924.1 30S ribosomal protein S8 [Deinococcus metallilatus]